MFIMNWQSIISREIFAWSLSVSVLHNYASKFHAHAQFNINNKCATQFPVLDSSYHILLPLSFSWLRLESTIFALSEQFRHFCSEQNTRA